MRPNLNISFGKKFRSIGDTEPADIPALLKDFLPEGMTGPAWAKENYG